MSMIALGRSAPAGLRFAAMPITEAKADANNYVVEFDGTANETGVGGGLTGANLVLTDTNTVGDASGGWRKFTGGGQMHFVPTLAWLNKFTRNAAGFGLLYHLKDFNFAAGNEIAYFVGLVTAEWSPILEITNGGCYIYDSEDKKFGVSAVDVAATWTALPASGEAWVLFSLDYANNLGFCGVSIGATQPAKITDFAYFGMNMRAQDPNDADITGFYTNRSAIVGYNAGASCADFYIKSLTATLYPPVTYA